MAKDDNTYTDIDDSSKFDESDILLPSDSD